MKNIIRIKKNGTIEIIDYSSEAIEKLDKKRIHKCGESCINACPSKCEKIRDYEKKDIEEYPFITEGYQAFGDDEKIIQFAVFECKNYQKAEDKIKTIEEKIKLINIRNSLILNYVEASTPEEAYKTLSELMTKGIIENPRGTPKHQKSKKKRYSI